MADDVRKPPISAILCQHPQGVRGTCGWCGGAVEERTPGRGWLKWWHDACAEEKAIIEKPDSARRALLERDKGICCDCGEDWSEMYRLVPAFREKESGDARPCFAQARPGGDAWPMGYYVATQGWESPGFYPWTETRAISLWHADHKIPLWKVAHMPDLERIAYFKLANLVTRCHKCHERKSSKEAAERAKFDAQAKHFSGITAKKPKHKWKSRGFPPKGSRPMRGNR